MLPDVRLARCALQVVQGCCGVQWSLLMQSILASG